MGDLRVLRGDSTITSDDIKELDETLSIAVVEAVYLYSKDSIQVILAKNILQLLGHELPTLDDGNCAGCQ